MMVKNMVLLCKSAQTSSTQKKWPQTNHLWTGEEGYQTQGLYDQNLSKGLTHPLSHESRPPPPL